VQDAAVRTPAPGFLNQESPAARSIQPSPSKSAAPPAAADLKPDPTVCFTQWSGEQYSHQTMGALALVCPLQLTSRWPEAKSWSPSLSRSVSDVIETQRGLSLNRPMKWVLKGKRMSGGPARVNPAIGVGSGPGSEQAAGLSGGAAPDGPSGWPPLEAPESG